MVSPFALTIVFNLVVATIVTLVFRLAIFV